MTLSVEGHGGTKASVSGTSVQWVAGETVKINGIEYTIAVADGKAYTSSAVTEADAYYGYYPASLSPGIYWITGHSVTILGSYESRYEDGRQVIALPMVAYSATATNELQFRHLTAALHVQVTNSAGYRVYLDKVVVRSASQQLSGMVSMIDLAAADLGLSPNIVSPSISGGPDNSSQKVVTVSFANEEVSIAAGGNLNVQVPILPIAAKTNDLTVEVYAHSKADIAYGDGHLPAHIDLTFSQTKAAPALARNVMSRAAVTLTNGTGNTTVVDHSTFSVASNQYDRIGNSSANLTINGNGTVSATGTVDLFGWSTSATYFGINNSTTSDPDYGGDFVDWGNLAIYNGGNTPNSGWRTMSGNTWGDNEWDYLINTRTASTVCGTSNARYARGTVNNVPGVILFPRQLHPSRQCAYPHKHQY